LARRNQLGHERGYLGGGVELAGLLAGRGGETGDQIFVSAADNIERADAARTQIQLGLGEIFEQMAKYVVLG
jgi:hypothetical protein